MKSLFNILSLSFAFITLSYGQYIAEVLEYKPAPGQLINTQTWGNPGSTNSIVGGINGSLCLGAFGGYVVFKFENPVENDPQNPFGIDFTIFGNPTQNWAEPGIVSVMKDENDNGQPDDNWYELAGSDYWFSSSIKNYEVTYTNPGGQTAADVPWNDNLGNNGFIYANAIHPQAYYPLTDSFPSIAEDNYALSGTLIRPVLDTSNHGFVQSPQRAFGCADNYPRGSTPYTVPDNPYTAEKENSGGDAFDISWAVDDAGIYVDLDEVDFVKVHNGVQDEAGWLGEISTEITGAVAVSPDNSIAGNMHLVVIQDLPAIIKTQNYQLHGFAFYQGRLMPDAQIIWQTNMPDATIDQNNLLSLTSSGELQITASLQSNPEISATATTLVDLSSASVNEGNHDYEISLYPNPAKDYFKISGIEKAEIAIFGFDGKIFQRDIAFYKGNTIGISTLKSGVYLVRVINEDISTTLKLIKE